MNNKIADTSIELVNSVSAVVKEVGEMLNGIPYVKSLSGVILQIIKIRDEIKANKKRCHEIIDKVLRMSKSIYEKLAEVARSNKREKLSRLEGHLTEHERLINRGLDDLNEHDRRLDELNTQLILDIIFHITMEQASAAPTGNQATPTEHTTQTDLEHFLPPKPSLIVEREGQINAILEILLRDEPSRVVLLGGGGFGKTTLAREILHTSSIITRYQLRYFLPCEGLPDVDTFLIGFGSMLGIKATPTAVLASAQRILEKSTALICLDNYETPWEPFETRTKIEEVLESIASIPNSSLIVTLRGEQRPSKVSWSKPLLPPLSTISLDGAKTIVENIGGNDAVDIYTLKLLEAIDGIPLAITLVATLLRDGESAESLWKRWSANSTEIIQTGGDDRQSNLNRSIALSVNSIRMKKNFNASRQLLAALSLLPDGFSSDADIVEHLQNQLNITDAYTVLQTLRIVALIRVDETSTLPRFNMLSPIRLFCSRFLAEDIKLVHTKIVDYYISTLLRAKYNIDNPENYAKIAPEVKNIHSVFQKSFMTATQEVDLQNLIQATIYLADWSWYTGYYAKDVIEMALAKSMHTPIIHADGLIALGNLHKWEADHENAEKSFREAASLHRKSNNSRGEANALKHLGDTLLEMRRIDDAEDVLQASLSLYAQANDKWGLPNVHFSLGTLYLQKDQYMEAEKNLTSALQAYETSTDIIGWANTTQSLCWLHIQLENLVEAEKYANESLSLSKRANYAVGIGNALGYLGDLYLFTDRIIEATEVLDQAKAIYMQQNNLINQLITAEQLAFAYIQSDRVSAAETLLIESTKVDLDVVQSATIFGVLGLLYVRTNDAIKAEHYLNNALQRLQKFEDNFEHAKVLLYLGTLYFKTCRMEEAEKALNSIPDLLSWRGIEMHRLWVLGVLYVNKGELENAEESLESALIWAKRHQSSYQQGNIVRSMGILFLKRGRIDLAIEKFQEALRFHRKAQWISEQATDLKRISEAYKILGLSEEAEAASRESEGLMDSIPKYKTLSLMAFRTIDDL
ncbi:TPR-like protein [Pholiota conissans]|uniref:TPR-like protein n=1 Tax=Pholiota conissans TaxID=109636 RepID=A0A9P5YYZ0_9AGAR|nr:TPR-like protein [Pholiota conissans]